MGESPLVGCNNSRPLLSKGPGQTLVFPKTAVLLILLLMSFASKGHSNSELLRKESHISPKSFGKHSSHSFTTDFSVLLKVSLRFQRQHSLATTSESWSQYFYISVWLFSWKNAVALYKGKWGVCLFQMQTCLLPPKNMQNLSPSNEHSGAGLTSEEFSFEPHSLLVQVILCFVCLSLPLSL